MEVVMAFRLIVSANCTVEINGANSVRVDCLDGEVELVVELAVPVKPAVPAEYWQDTDVEPLIPNAPRPRDPEDELPF
jgi:hypothetical protein